MNELKEKNKKIEDYIFEVRGKQIILDKDLAFLYNCKNGTKSINLAVKRNRERFPDDFMFQLTEEEVKSLSRFHVETLNKNNQRQGLNIKYLPYAFTEEGVAMISSLLHTETAVNTSILIMKAFVSMKKYISSNLLEQKFINNMVLEHDNDIKLLKETFSKFDNISNEIFYEGEIFDAYYLLLKIFDSSMKSIIIIDNKKLYHCGASFKDLGIKCFSINKIDSIDMINDILNRL